MKSYLALFSILCFISTSCTQRQIPYDANSSNSHLRNKQAMMKEEVIKRSLFESAEATISEEDIHRLLDGDIVLPKDAKVALYMLPSYSYYHLPYSSNTGLNLHRDQLNSFAEAIKSSENIKEVSVLPSLLIPRKLSVTTLREAAVRMQADLLVILSVESDIYRNTKLFKKNEAKAYTSTEMLIMDVRTGLIPITGVATEEVLKEKTDEAFNQQEFIASVLRAAVSKSLISASEMGIVQLAQF